MVRMRNSLESSRLLIVTRFFIHCCWRTIAWGIIAPFALAGVPTVTATGEYRMGPYDSIGEGQRLALVTAKSMVLDQAVAYLDTLPTLQPLGLNRDELRAYSAGLLAIKLYPATPSQTRQPRLRPSLYKCPL